MKLTNDAVEFAKIHIKKFYDSDFFPKPFEYLALWDNWSDVKSYLITTELDDILMEDPTIMCSPKPSGTFRIVHQLDPISSIVYTALTYMIAEKIERNRFELSKQVACSYRVSIDKNTGTFFENGTGYKDFLEKCSELNGMYEHVLITDISDFYNQVYVHRLRNAISSLDPNFELVAKSIEDFLLAINGSPTKGIPVGPASSIIMAEALMIDVDEFIHNSGFKHTRYVDDFRIFANSQSDLVNFLERLTKYLFENHRLHLSSSKTEIISRADFVQNYLESPENIEKLHIHQKLAEMMEPQGPYRTYEEEPELPSETNIRPTVMLSMCQKLLALEKLDLGVARHILRQCRQYRIRSVSKLIIDNFGYFCPVINDVALYLDKVSNPRFIELNTSKFEDLIINNSYAQLPFVRLWLSEYFRRNHAFLKSRVLADYVACSLHHEAYADHIIDSSNLAEFRRIRDSLNEVSDRKRRAIFKASLVTAKDDRDAWLNSISRRYSTNIIDMSVIKWVKAKNKS
ncbi:reverse transcriptase [Vibrio cholerae]|uniref:RNA-directed DNA polymerase n=1 Tax=Vibrio cholerae TaxID=666 RepID=UPI001159E181|nr:RNA-directed DNA polymerase [Vibrio cholerae]EGR5123459.1 RNA-directed DNA polymerase [Vibrio cholerae]EKF9070868.1 RNA-directed DNA polymerase [Vibrio cholerae]ELH5152424.1 RNA-directed DNA polymerase [Vibrio cholerae]QKU90967.1 RNA-directed DNA polymerase [Vibrio cholerae]TQQ38410.1 RNA-directed DNA polymerase [Vibrio cholerae]